MFKMPPFPVNLSKYFVVKDNERNLCSATFHMMSITWISMSLVDLTWFNISGNVCVPYLTLGQFFWFGYETDAAVDYSSYDCINSTVVNLMRTMILLCFMAIIFAVTGFFLDIIGPNAIIYRLIRKYALPRTCTILWIMVIITLSYYIVALLRNLIDSRYPSSEYDVTYGMGFYLLAAAGCIEGVGLVHTLLFPYKSSYEDDEQCLTDAFDDMDHFDSPTPPPPYSLPPPPYSP